MEFYDLEGKKRSDDINLIFDDWKQHDERVVIFSPHDDDIVLGAAYASLAVLAHQGEIFVVIFNDGSAGYSKLEMKNKIVDARKKETINALNKLSIKKENVFRLNLPDFSGIHYLGWKLPWSKPEDLKSQAIFPNVISLLRKIKSTRLIFPNGYREHIDHTAVCMSAMFDGPQAGDTVIVDYGVPSKIKTYLQYSVWSDLTPEDSLLAKRDLKIRANKAIVVDKDSEKIVVEALKEFKSQQDIISYILDIRKGRKIDNNKFLEVYLKTDPRPQMDYDPYKRLISEINKK